MTEKFEDVTQLLPCHALLQKNILLDLFDLTSGHVRKGDSYKFKTGLKPEEIR